MAEHVNDVDDSCDSSSDIGKTEFVENESQIESGSESQMDFADIGIRNSSSGGLTMKEYEEQLKKLTAENFNLKLRVYFVEERLSKVTGISDKEDLIKKNIQLKVTCESQLKELENKQELLFEASKAFELLQKEHAEEIERLIKEKDRERAELEEKLMRLEANYLDLKSKFPDVQSNSNSEFKSFEDYASQIQELESNLKDEEEKFKEAELQLKDQQLEIESFHVKIQRLENELEQRVHRIDELVDELEQKERDMASANFRIRKLEDEIKSKQREDEIMKERIDEKNKTIESLKNSLAIRDETIEVLENRVAKERSSSQSLQSKIDSLAFQNARLKEELDILQSRLRRTADSLSPRGKSRPADDEAFKQKYEDMVRAVEEQEIRHAKRIKEIEDRLSEKDAEAEDYRELFEKHKKLEDDHRKACTALKNFIRRSSEEKKEKEALNRMLNNQEEVIADLTAQLEQLKTQAMEKHEQDDKLSLTGTGDNDRKILCAVGDGPRCKKENETDEARSEEKEKAVPLKEKLEKISELETELIILELQLDEKSDADSKELLLNELESKKSEIDTLNQELQKQNVCIQELKNKEFCDIDRQIEKLEKRLTESSEENQMSREVIIGKKLSLLGMGGDKLSEDKHECLQIECVRAKEQADKAEAMRKGASEVCTLLSVRLEELAVFLDSLLTNDLLNGIGVKKRQDIRRVMEKSRELSRHLSLSFAKRNFSDSSLFINNLEIIAHGDGLALTNDSMLATREKVISEQSIIINRLREQLKILNQEIKQRDIELSHCQDDFKDRNLMGEGIEGQSLSICQEISDDDGEIGEVSEDCLGFLNVYATEEKRSPTLETSESETWSEPDRSVSLARMGRLEEVGVNLPRRNSKCEDSTESSEGTLNENSKNPGKRGRSTESEVRRLQSRIKALNEVNENLQSEINFLKNEKVDPSFASRLQKNEEANLMEKLRKTMDRLEECSLTCRQLEDKLAGALERASTTAMQLSKAQETISDMEQEIIQLKNEIAIKKLETKEKEKRIAELEKKMEEMTIESEQKIEEAMKQKELAEKKTLEVECRLKDAENMSKEVESKVIEIEKKITETKKFKNETVMHFKEAEKHVDTAEKMMEEAERIKAEAEKKSKDFQNFIDLMRKEVEEKLKEAEKRVKKSEKEKDELEKQVMKLKKKLMEAEKNKTEVEVKVKEGKETIQCMEEKLRELEVAMDQRSEEAQRKIKEMQKKADARVTELEIKIEEREWVRKTETEKKMAEAEKLSRELEVGFKRQLEEAEKRVKKARENAEAMIKKVLEEAEKQACELRKQLVELELEKEEECSKLRKQLDEAKLEASELELELTKLTNEKIHLEEELRKMLEKESVLVKDNREIKGKYESSIHELENKLTQLTLNKSHLAARLEEIESTNFDLVARISAIRGKETMVVEREFTALSPPYSPPQGSLVSTLFGEVDFEEVSGNRESLRQGSAGSDPGEANMGMFAMEAIGGPRRHMNSSPDLGIESDPGRFSSLEASQQANGDQISVLGCTDASEIKKLEAENAELKRRLMRTRQALEETLTQLSAANQRKKQVERAICKQLHKTHHILKKARVNFESQDGDPIE